MSHALVVHCRRKKFDVYVGRSHRQKDTQDWGNPFHIGEHGTREEVIAKYKTWLLERPWLVARAREQLKGKTLGCFCAPEACHGDVLAEIAALEPVYHTPCDPCKGVMSDRPCMKCEGGLFICTDCGATEGSLTTECPKGRVSAELGDKVYKGEVNYIAGQWVGAARVEKDNSLSMPFWCGPLYCLSDDHADKVAV